MLWYIQLKVILEPQTAQKQEIYKFGTFIENVTITGCPGHQGSENEQ